jgi:hypothetical protein
MSHKGRRAPSVGGARLFLRSEIFKPLQGLFSAGHREVAIAPPKADPPHNLSKTAH